MSYVDVLKHEMAASQDDPAFAGGCSDEAITEFENALKVNFPEDYKIFLRRFGALSFGGETFYGITQSGLKPDEAPCVYFATETARSQGDADAGMIVVKSSGYGPIYSIDTHSLGSSGKPAVVETGLSFKRDKLKVLAYDSFEAFFSATVRQAILDV
ncbi:SMI1/KNR4 family protein [Pseudomonas sp. KNUC1026]|uniref:SMI1/KNR4 family protein n=1 Tax=Pseudomonas sp. KNUC1026 TaxID=2893890 RepID=UPI001F4014FB|nr:SMI1/KNR4 family protein [Pseudomonas sp. KNUC1026]UFH49888.1 SMI1/KNR4 family protein [Pseudomonas sp. KNUC1026]